MISFALYIINYNSIYDAHCTLLIWTLILDATNLAPLHAQSVWGSKGGKWFELWDLQHVVISQKKKKKDSQTLSSNKIIGKFKTKT